MRTNEYPEIRNIREWLYQNKYHICIPDSDEIRVDHKWSDALLRNCRTSSGQNALETFHVFLNDSNADMELFQPDHTYDICESVRVEFIPSDDAMLMLIEIYFTGLPGEYATLWEIRKDDSPSPYLVCCNTRNIMWKYSFDRMIGIVSSLLNLYNNVQFYFFSRPQLFRQSQKRHSFQEIKNTEKAYHAKEHICKIQKIICLCDEDISDTEVSVASNRIYSCERWSVAGHYRTYKSGKKVWVRPYEKGKNRNNNSANFTAKKYVK